MSDKKLEEIALQMRKALVDLIHQNTRLQSGSAYSDLGPTCAAAKAIEEFDKKLEIQE